MNSIVCSATSRNGGKYEFELENARDTVYMMPSRKGWKFVDWYDDNDKVLSVDNLVDGQTYYAKWADNIAPTLSVVSTSDVAEKQTVTLYGKDDGSGVAGYYVGQQDPQQTDVAFSDSTADTFSGSVTASGTWYFAVKDTAGNITVKSKDYCKISFGLKAGESVNPGCVVIEKGTSVYLPIPDKSGYAFMGWSATQDPTDTGALFTTMTADEDTEIYPYFVDNIKPTFTVKATPGSIGYSGALSFENVVETGSGIAGYYIGQKNPASENVTYGSTTSVTVNRSGVWYLAIKDNAGNVAVEQRAYYLLALNADGATNYTSNSAYIKANTAVTLPTGLTKSGYTANTWTGGIHTITLKQDTNLSPVWGANKYTLYFNANGGSVSEASRKVTYGTTYGTLPTPTRAGCTFAGWYNAPSGGTQVSANTVMAASDTTIYAHWTANTYTLYFNANGGSVSEGSRSVTYNSTYGNLPTPTATGYTFLGWFTAASGGNQVSSGTHMGASDTTIYAHWSINTYTLYFNANGGNVSETSRSVTYNSSYGSLPTPTRSDHTFLGWFTEANGGTQVSNTTRIGNSNVTVYAHWQLTPVTLRMNQSLPCDVTLDTGAYNNRGYHHMKIEFHNCGNHTANGGEYSNSYGTSIYVKQSNGSSAFGSNLTGSVFTWDRNYSGTTTIDITGCSYVNVQAGVSGSNDAGAHWECHNCTITITLEE